MPWFDVRQLFPLKVYYSRTTPQNVTKFGVNHHWGSEINFIYNEGAGPPGAREGPNRGIKGKSLKGYSSRMVQ